MRIDKCINAVHFSLALPIGKTFISLGWKIERRAGRIRVAVAPVQGKSFSIETKSMPSIGGT